MSIYLSMIKMHGDYVVAFKIAIKHILNFSKYALQTVAFYFVAFSFTEIIHLQVPIFWFPQFVLNNLSTTFCIKENETLCQ